MGGDGPDRAPDPGVEGATLDGMLRAFFRRGESEAVPEEPGDRFRILGEVRNGGRTTVYRAEDRTLDREVALEVLAERVEEGREVLGGFLSEAQVTAQLQHPGILPVLGLGFLEDGRPYVARRMAEGETLEDLLARGAGRTRLLGVLEQAAHALAYAHARGVAHGAVTASSVISCARGGVVVTGWDRAVRVNGDQRALRADVDALREMLAMVLAASPPEDARDASASAVACAVGYLLVEDEARARTVEITAARERARSLMLREKARAEDRKASLAARARRRTMAVACVALLAAFLGGGALVWRRIEDRTASGRGRTEVTAALREASRHEAAGNWSEATAWSAKGFALSRSAGGDLREKARTVKDRIAKGARIAAARSRLLGRLAEIRLTRLDGSLDMRGRDDAYCAAFRDAGLDLERGDPTEIGDTLRRFPEVGELVAVIDELWTSRGGYRVLEGREWRRLLAVVRRTDPDPWRMELRDAVLRGDAEAVESLAARADSGRVPDGTRRLLVTMLREGAKADAASDLVRDALRRCPGDRGWIVGRHAAILESGRLADGVADLAAHLALEPESAVVWNNLGSALVAAGRSESAVTALRRSISIENGSSPARYTLYKVLTTLGRLDEAGEAIRTALSLDPTDVRLKAAMAEHHRLVGEFDAAVALGEEIRETDPGTGWNTIGFTLVARGDLRDAVDALRRAIDHGEASYPTWRFLGDAYQQLGRPDDAIEAIRRALRDEGVGSSRWGGSVWILTRPAREKAMDLANLAGLLSDRGELAEAEQHARAAAALDPRVPLAHANLGMILLKTGRLPDAIESLERSIRLEEDPAWSAPECDLTSAHSNLGVAYLYTGRADDAVRELRLAVKRAPERPDYRQNLCEALQGAGRMDEALEVALEVTLLHSKHGAGWSTLAVVRSRRGELDESVAAARTATELAPADPRPWYVLGTSLLLQNRPREARGPLEEAVRRDPRDARSRAQLGNALHALGQHREARDRFLEALRLSGPEPVLLSRLALLLSTCPDAEVRDIRMAERMARQIILRAPSLSSGWGALGIVRCRAGDHRGAIEAFEKGRGVTQDAHADEAYGGFHRAMAHAHLGERANARAWFDRSDAWMQASAPHDADLKRFRAEAAELLGIEDEEGK